MGERQSGFSLLEVVTAIGVFALGIVVVLGLFGPLTALVSRNRDAETAAQVAEALRLELSHRVRRAGTLEPVVALFANGGWADLRTAPDRVLLANRTGTRIVAAPWAVESSGEPFFEISIARNTKLSPAANDVLAVALVYTARIRWPATSDSEAGSQQTWYVAGSIRL